MFDAAFTRHAENGRVSVARLLPLLRDLSEPAGSTPASSAVLACAIAHVSDGRPAVAILRTASDAQAADRPVSLMQRLLCAAKFRQDVARDGRLTVDDQKSAPPFSVHCMQLDELLFFAITHCDYPRHLVFPAIHPELGLLPHLATSCLASGEDVLSNPDPNPNPKAARRQVRQHAWSGLAGLTLNRAPTRRGPSLAARR